jgi:hypothetical protein
MFEIPVGQATETVRYSCLCILMVNVVVSLKDINYMITTLPEPFNPTI